MKRIFCMKRILQLFFILSLVLIMSCSSREEPITDEPLENITEDIPIPTPNSQSGVIYGILISQNGDIIQDGIFLSQNIAYGNPEIPPTVSFSYQNSPRAMVNPDSGYFYFAEITPAENYVLVVLVGPGELMVVKDADGETPLQISINAGESIDLGSITVDLP